MAWLIFGAVWIVCGVLAYGVALAHWRREVPADSFRSATGPAFYCGFLGPIGLIAALVTSGMAEHGLMYRNPHKRRDED
jgi:hypothetical protein